MTSKEKILQAVAAAKPAFIAAPEIAVGASDIGSVPVQEFIATLESIGGKSVQPGNLQQIKDDLEKAKQEGKYIVNAVPELGEVNNEVNYSSDAIALAPVYKAFIRGTLGVAENGAVWIAESDMLNRLLPFICQHLVLVLDRQAIVPDMYAAYRKINRDTGGYGVFLAGPSKTADIEQSLVIGAHGARSLLVYLL